MGLLGPFTLRLTFLLLIMARFSFALPAHHGRSSTHVRRITYAVIRDIVVDEAAGTVVNSMDQSRIDQGSASDGAGSGFNVPAVLWLSFGLAVGLYLTLGGMRLWRMTTAFAVGLVFALCGRSLLSNNPCSATYTLLVAWVAIINAMNAAGLSDLILTLITLSFFVLGSLGGLFKIFRLAGLTALSIIGGMSVGMRIVLMREGLLLHSTALNWVIIVVCAVAGFAVTLLRQKIGIVRVIP